MTALDSRVRAPWWPIAGSLFAVAVSAALFVIHLVNFEARSIPLLIVGYLTGAVATTVLASVYRALRNARRSHPRFQPQRPLDRAAVGAMVIGLLAGMGNAVLLATELAKL